MIVDTNTKLTVNQRQWMINQIIDSMIETDSIETEDQEKKERESLSKFSDSDLVFEFAGWNPGAIC